MNAIKFVAYQLGTIPARTIKRKDKKREGMIHESTVAPKEVSIAVEMEATVPSATPTLAQLLGSIFTEVFHYADTVRAVVKKSAFSMTLPVYLRFEFNGVIVDTASYPKVIALALKYGNTPERKKEWAKKLWVAINYDLRARIPATYLPATGEIETHKALQDAKKKVTTLENRLIEYNEQSRLLIEAPETPESLAALKKLNKQMSTAYGQLKVAQRTAGIVPAELAQGV